MDVQEIVDKLIDELVAEGWSEDGAANYASTLLSVRGEVEREMAVMFELRDLGLLWLVESEPVAVYEQPVAVYA